VRHRDRLGADPGRPHVALLDDQTCVVEDEERHTGDGLDLARPRRDRSPPLDGGAVAVDDRLAEPALGRRLILEGPGDVLANVLTRTKRMREEDRIAGVERDDRVEVRGRPGLRPDVCPPTSCLRRVYFATSIARDSRMTITFT
jgi:hypothetical protein